MILSYGQSKNKNSNFQDMTTRNKNSILQDMTIRQPSNKWERITKTLNSSPMKKKINKKYYPQPQKNTNKLLLKRSLSTKLRLPENTQANKKNKCTSG